MSELKHLTVVPSGYPHGDVWVVGNTEALIALRNAIDVVLSGNRLDGISAFAPDGEGYWLFVGRVGAEEFQGLVSTYYEPSDSLHKGVGNLPEDRFGPEEYGQVVDRIRKGDLDE